MSFQELMLTYGYPMLFFGVFLEGEAFLIIGAYLAHRGYFTLPYVMLVAALASFASGQLYFFLGYRYGRAFLARHPRWQARVGRVEQLLNRYGTGLVVGYRALLGLRTVIPAAVSLANYPPLRFSILNGVGAIVWALVIALAGSSLAQLVEIVFDDLRRHEWAVLLVVAGLGLGWQLNRLYFQAK